MTGESDADLFQDDPIAEPLTYPGRIPDTSGILIDDHFRPLRPIAGEAPEGWLTESEGSSATLADLLKQLRHEPLTLAIHAGPWLTGVPE